MTHTHTVTHTYERHIHMTQTHTHCTQRKQLQYTARNISTHTDGGGEKKKEWGPDSVWHGNYGFRV
jgi:hypothetical protein